MITDALIKAGKAQHVMHTCLLCRPIVFLHIHCSIMILKIKTVHFSISHCMWLHRKCPIHLGKTNKFKVCISVIQIYHISQNGWVSKVSGYRMDNNSSLCGRSMVSCLWCDIWSGSGAYLTSCTKVFRGFSSEVKQWKCYCDVSLHFLLQLRICESLLLPF